MKKFYSVIFCFLFLQISIRAQWFFQSSSTTVRLYGITFTSPMNGFAIGESGKILKTTDTGDTWIEKLSGTTNILRDIYFTNSVIGFVCGEFGLILKTTDGGDSWFNQVSGTSSELNGIFFSDTLNGFVVGSNGTILRTTNGGNSWLSIASGVSDYTLNDVSFLSTDYGFIVGGRFNGSGHVSVILKTTDGGNSWQLRNLPYYLTDVFIINTNNIIAVGLDEPQVFPYPIYGEIYRTTNGGNNWFSQQIAYPLFGVYFTDLNIGYAVGGRAPSTGTIIKTTNGGIDWINQVSGTSNVLNSVFFTDFNTGYVVGTNGTILKTINGGIVPVELLSFTTDVSGNNINLSWSTASELNNQGFEIERSKNKNDWIKIGFKEGKGTTTEQQNYSFTDDVNGINVPKLFYRLKQIDFDGSYEYSDIVEVDVAPMKFSLSQNYPNPFNPSTKISWQSPAGSHQSLKVYDVLGREVATLVDEYRDAGSYEVEFQSAVGNKQLASGVYYYQLKVGEFIQTKKMQVLK